MEWIDAKMQWRQKPHKIAKKKWGGQRTSKGIFLCGGVDGDIIITILMKTENLRLYHKKVIIYHKKEKNTDRLK